MGGHPSYGRYTPDQVKEAMNMPWGGAQRYLEQLKKGFCENCNKPFADIEKHKITNKYCREFYQDLQKREALRQHIKENSTDGQNES